MTFTFKKNPFHDNIRLEEFTRSNGKKYTKRESRERYFFPDEFKIFYDSLRKQQRFTFNFLINTGARINEIRSVKVADIDFERQNIVFRWTKSRNKDGTRRIRTIPISTEFRKYLQKYVNDNNIKQEDTLGVLSTPAANIAMKKALVKAKIPDWQMFSVHSVRKTTEMYLLALNIDTTKVEKHMGHSLAIAMKYYISPDIFSWDDKNQMRDIIGDLYSKTQQ